MKKLLPVIFTLLSLIAVLTSCSTSIALTTLAPAAVDVSGYKTIAVMSTQDKTGWTYPLFWNSYVPMHSVEPAYAALLRIMSNLDFNASSRVVETASNTIYSSIDNGYFKVVSPAVTDALVTLGKNNGNVRTTLLNNGVDAILTTEITNIYYDEYIVQERDKNPTTYNNESYYQINFYLVQKYAISINYVLQDVENTRIIATNTFSTDIQTRRTRLGHTVGNAGTFVKDSYYSIPKASELITGLIRSFASDFRNELTPHSEVNYFDFKPNKPKVASLEAAYDALDDERWNLALSLFSEEYRKSGHLASGYNAAILYFAAGEHDKAFALLDELMRIYGGRDISNLYSQLLEIKRKSDAAKSQIESTEKSGAKQSTELIGF